MTTIGLASLGAYCTGVLMSSLILHRLSAARFRRMPLPEQTANLLPSTAAAATDTLARQPAIAATAVIALAASLSPILGTSLALAAFAVVTAVVGIAGRSPGAPAGSATVARWAALATAATGGAWLAADAETAACIACAATLAGGMLLDRAMRRALGPNRGNLIAHVLGAGVLTVIVITGAGG